MSYDGYVLEELRKFYRIAKDTINANRKKIRKLQREIMYLEQSLVTNNQSKKDLQAEIKKRKRENNGSIHCKR